MSIFVKVYKNIKGRIKNKKMQGSPSNPPPRTVYQFIGKSTPVYLLVRLITIIQKSPNKKFKKMFLKKCLLFIKHTVIKNRIIAIVIFKIYSMYIILSPM